MRSPSASRSRRGFGVLLGLGGGALSLLCVAPLLVLLATCVSSVSGAPEYASFDGFYHNQHYPEWGSVESAFLRMGGGIRYKDKTYEPIDHQPNARLLSNELFDAGDADRSTRPQTSLKNRSVLLAFYGQQLFNELHDGQHAGCPIEYFNIGIPKCDEKFDPKCTDKAQMPFTRTKYVQTSGQGPSTPRIQISENSAWIDGGSIYGNGKTWADSLRARVGGRLRGRDGDARFPAMNDQRLPFTNTAPSTDNVGPGLIRHPKLRDVKEFWSQSGWGRRMTQSTDTMRTWHD